MSIQSEYIKGKLDYMRLKGGMQIGTKCDILKINKKIDSGASKMHVYEGKYNLLPSIIKQCYENEISIIEKLNNTDYIVQLFDVVSFNILKSFDQLDIIENPDTKRKTKYIIMEKLEPIDLYDDNSENNSKNKNALSEYVTVTKAYGISPYTKVILTSEQLDIFIQLTRIMIYIHKQNIGYGDLKQENMGVDQHNNIKIFDFGESVDVQPGMKKGAYELDPRQNDIITLAKLFINILTKKYVFAPGRHYNSHHFTMKEADFDFIFEHLIMEDEILKQIMRKMCNTEDNYDESILPELLNYLIHIKPNVRPSHIPPRVICLSDVKLPNNCIDITKVGIDRKMKNLALDKTRWKIEYRNLKQVRNIIDKKSDVKNLNNVELTSIMLCKLARINYGAKVKENIYETFDNVNVHYNELKHEYIGYVRNKPSTATVIVTVTTDEIDKLYNDIKYMY